MSGLVGNTLQGEAAMMMATQPPVVRKGSYTPDQARKVAETPCHRIVRNDAQTNLVADCHHRAFWLPQCLG